MITKPPKRKAITNSVFTFHLYITSSGSGPTVASLAQFVLMSVELTVLNQNSWSLNLSGICRWLVCVHMTKDLCPINSLINRCLNLVCLKKKKKVNQVWYLMCRCDLHLFEPYKKGSNNKGHKKKQQLKNVSSFVVTDSNRFTFERFSNLKGN